MKDTAPSILSQSASSNFAAYVLTTLLFCLSHVSRAKFTNPSGSEVIYSYSIADVLIKFKHTQTNRSLCLSTII